MLKATVLSALFLQCAPDISPVTLHALVGVESGGNPYVVANVTDNKSAKFNNKEDAVLYVNKLAEQNKTYSAGLMQIYSKNFSAYGLTNETVFDHCTNIKAGADILKQCFVKALKENSDDKQTALRKSFSCYYSGNMSRGFKKESDGKSYVQRIELKAEKNYQIPDIAVSSKNIPVSDIQNTDKEAVIVKQNEDDKPSQQWDVFGDYKL
ncbi:lytic transglycosylase domain-containing protein [Morganella morganii]|uniref:lytic transglycosylase domain-containing protein n=1 Tax=Morganella morganii TaxID=582 RepID=UPI0016482D27|nr:lytic transglycosylase domain-containing protein [Morganella morganii]MBC3997489.1 lytic transglycosylase domain-containing protein [Morganella morganii]